MPQSHSSFLKHLTLQMMAQDSKGMMMKSLLGLLLCSSLTSAAIFPSTYPGPEDDYPLDYPIDNEIYPTNSDGHPLPFDPIFNSNARSHNDPPEQNPYPIQTGMNMTGKGKQGDPGELTLLENPGGGPEPDMSYCQMLLDSPVPPPMDQVPWFCVCSRCKSNVGSKGDRGDRGLPGRPGSPGMRGLTGFRGRPGFTGRQGIKGQKGDDGEKGERGILGFAGTKGGRGFKGDKGDMGLQGLQGEQGTQGEAGRCSETCVSVQGPTGATGLPGPAGTRGLPGLGGSTGATGLKGDTGDAGELGAPGSDGEKGEHGAMGECNCTDGTNGTNGQPGPMGHKGEQGEVGTQGAMGMDGAKGDMGDMGMRGQPGPCTPAIQSSFSAALSGIYPQPNMPVPFTHVISNRGMNFDPDMGIYTAPINGTYVFSYNLVVFSKVLKVGLFHEFLPIVKTTGHTDLSTISQQVVLHMSMLDQVWLQVKDTDNNGMFSDPESSSTFSGYLLNPDSCDLPMFRDFYNPMSQEGTYDWGDLDNPAVN